MGRMADAGPCVAFYDGDVGMAEAREQPEPPGRQRRQEMRSTLHALFGVWIVQSQALALRA